MFTTTELSLFAVIVLMGLNLALSIWQARQANRCRCERCQKKRYH